MNYKTKPFDHQRQYIDKYADREYFGIFAEQGLGKSKMILDNVTYLKEKGEIDSVMIVAPNGLHNNWYWNEIPAHLGCEHISLSWQANHTKKWLGGWGCFMGEDIHPKFIKIFCINVEALRTINGYKYAQEFIKKNEATMFVLDESTCIKNPTAKQTKAVTKLAHQCKYKRILTGTPITQGPLDIFSQSRCLSRTALPYTSFTAFKAKFAIEETNYAQGRSYRKVTGYRNLEELTVLMGEYSVRILKKDCLDLPDKMYQKIMIEMKPDQRKLYDQMKDDCLLLLEDNLVSVTNVLTKIIKLQQICCGFVSDDNGDVLQVNDGKIVVLMQTLEAIEGKVVIFCSFKHNVKRIMEEIKKTYGPNSVVDYTGDTKDRIGNTKLFQESKVVKYMVATSAAEKGVTLHASSTMIYFSNNYKLESRLQSEDRIHRIGQGETCNYIDLVMKDTIDEAVLKALTDKNDISKMVLDDLRKII